VCYAIGYLHNASLIQNDLTETDFDRTEPNNDLTEPNNDLTEPNNDQARFDPSRISVKNCCKYIDFYADLRGGSRMTSTKRCKNSIRLSSMFVSYRIITWSRKQFRSRVPSVRPTTP
jgi:hypothetical protein